MPTEWTRWLRTGSLLVATWIAGASAGAYQERGAPFDEVAFGMVLGAVFAVAAVVRERER